MTAGASTTNGGQSANAPTVSIVEIQQNESGTASPYAGERVTTNGTVTAVVPGGPGGFYIQDGAGEYRGVFVNAENPSAYAEGDVVNVTAPVEENFELTRLNLSAAEASAEKTGTASVPEPVVLNTTQVSQEAYEGVLVEVRNLTVTATPNQFGSGGSLQVSGVTYEFIDRPDAGTVRNVFVNGEPLDTEATYTVTVNSFMNGWDRISEMPTVETDPTQYGTAVAEYLEERSPITPTDADRIRRVTRTATSDDAVVPGLNSTYTLSFEAPFVEDAAPETFRIENETNAVVDARAVAVDGDSLAVTVNETVLSAMADSSLDLQLYGKYNDTEYTHEFLTDAVVNTNVPVTVPPMFGDSPAQNADDDLALEDVNDDGEVTVADVQVFFQNRGSETVQSNTELFDFDQDGSVTIGDVQILFDEVVAAT